MSLFDDIIISGDQFSKVIGYIPALIALLGTAATIYFNKKTSNENRKANEEIAEKQRLLQLDLNTKQQEFQNEIRKLNEKHLTDLKNKELATNIIAKQRLDWLDKIRNFTGEFIVAYYNLIGDLTMEVTKEEHAEHLRQYNKYYRLLFLYYPLVDKNGKSNEDHQNIIEALNKLDNQVKSTFNFQEQYKHFPLNTQQLDEDIEEFMIQSTLYFKQVWNEAKLMI